MSNSCSIRAIWILNANHTVVFSRRFPVVEKRWRTACERYEEGSGAGGLRSSIPTDPEVSAGFEERKMREGSIRGLGVHVSQSTQGSDSWVDDPITRHIISLHVQREGEGFLVWPLVLHIRSYLYILILPLVEPRHLKSYRHLCSSNDSGKSIKGAESMSTLLLNLPCITGSFLVAHTIGDVIAGDVGGPEVVVSSSPSVGGLLDSLTGTIGISGLSNRAWPVAAAAPSVNSGASTTSSAAPDTPRSMSKSVDKDVLGSFISSSMPFGTPLDINYSNISAIKLNGFSSSDVLLQDLKQPAWKPYLYKGKQRLLFTIQEVLYASMYDRDDIPDSVFVSGQLNCRAELEGLPDVSLPLLGLNTAHVEVLSCHPCAQVPEQGIDKQALLFAPPLGNFTLMRYQVSSGLNPPVKGFYQLSMVSENKGAFLFKLQLMEGYKAPLTMDSCTVIMPFPRRRIVHFEGNPSIGTVSTTDHSIEWKIVTSGRGVTGKSIEATFPGTINFSPMPKSQRLSSQSKPTQVGFVDDDSDDEPQAIVNVEDYLIAKMNRDLQSVELEEPFSWQAYNYAKVSFKILSGTPSGMSIDSKMVSIYPDVKVPVEISMLTSSGDYILWNTLGKCPFATAPKA